MENNRAVYTIGIISELLQVHPETLRVWERHGIIKPQRRSNKRFYSETDLKRLRFIKTLMVEHLNLPAIKHYLKLYPCWETNTCPVCMSVTQQSACTKPCWREEGSYCQVYGNPVLCAKCDYSQKRTGQSI